jgi:prepilin-type processing-associated H-X9-DG protein
MYAQDYDEMLLMGMWGTSASGTLCSWPAMVQPYIKSSDVFRCPSIPDAPGITAGTVAATGGCGIGAGFVNTYAYNYYLAGNNNASGGVMTSSLPQMQKSAQTVMLVDGAATAQAAPIQPENWPDKRTSIATGAGGSTTANRAPYLLVHSGSSLMASNNDYGGPKARHLGMTNVLWADGHAKAAKIQSFFVAPGDNTWQATCAPLLTGTGIASASCSPCLLPQLGCQP